jgi:hypothetical protein
MTSTIHSTPSPTRRSSTMYAQVDRMRKADPSPPPRRPSKEENKGTRLEDEGGTLGLLVTAELEVLASLKRELCLGLHFIK